MVFKFATVDPAQDPDDFNHAFPQSAASSPSAAAATICQPRDYTDGCIRALVSRCVVTGTSRILRHISKFFLDVLPVNLRKLLHITQWKDFVIEPRESMLKLKDGPYKYGELARITRNFAMVLVEGGSGNVYFGTLEDGTKVAVKVFFCFSIRGSREFQAKAKNLRAVRHQNLVPLLGYCDGTKTKALIYQFMDGGNLRQNLSGDGPNFLTWRKRLQIAVDVAQSLDFLHHGCHLPIIHGDLSAANIWLNDKMQAKIADFGISAFEPRALDSYPTCPLGTPGYFDPEFYPYSRSDRKSDVYSFGIILFELITGHPAVIRGAVRNVFLLQWMTPIIETKEIQMIMDPRLQGKFDVDSAWKAVEIAESCTRPTGVERPDITHVLVALRQSLAIQLASQ